MKYPCWDIEKYDIIFIWHRGTNHELCYDKSRKSEGVFMLYHVSPNAGMKTLIPHVSTHKKAYVYAVENMVTGLLFGAKQDDFDFVISTDENGIPTVYECYPDAF